MLTDDELHVMAALVRQEQAGIFTPEERAAAEVTLRRYRPPWFWVDLSVKLAEWTEEGAKP